jgi:hypothetical protein
MAQRFAAAPHPVPAMALTPSTMLPLGTPLPLRLLEEERDRGSLTEVVGRLPSAASLAGRPPWAA